jgi:DNA-binding LytR/AlgR family response regulator
MKFNLFINEALKEEYVDIYCIKRNPTVDKILLLKEGLEILGKDENDIQVILSPETILYFDSVDKTTFAYTKNQAFEIQGTLKNLEQSLEVYGFVRISKSNIVNIYHIKKLVPEYNMRIRAYFENDEFLIINRAYKKDFSQALKERRNLI